MSALEIRPWTVKQALPFVRLVHRRLPNAQGAMWAVSVRRAGEIVGAAIVGWPAREWNGDTLAVLRVAVIGATDPTAPPLHPNACSMLYGACARAGRAMGAANMVTYTHGDEHGSSLRAAGWVEDEEMTSGGEWDRLERQRDLALDAAPKRRWFAPWSARAKQIKAVKR